MSIKLYEITKTYREALEILTDPENDFEPQVIADTLESIGIEFEQKAVNVAAFARQLEKEAEAIKAEEERMARRRKALEARAKWLKDYVKGEMELIDVKKVSCPWFVLSVQKNPASVEILDENAIPDQFKRPVIAIHIDKAAIKEALSAGQVIPGAKLANGTRLSIR